MFTKFFEDAKKNKTIAGLDASQTVDQNAIEKCSLEFVVKGCGKLDVEIVDDPNLNAELLDTFAQTFVRHFWNDSIGYDNEMSFWFRLRSFFDENLPLWAQYFREAVLNNKALITSVNITKGNNTDVLHVEGKTDTLGTNQADNTGQSVSDTKYSSNTNGREQDTDNIETTEHKTDRNTSRKFNVDADTPQDQVNIENIDDTSDPMLAYNFKYASDASGEHELNYDEEDTKSNTNETKDNSTNEQTTGDSKTTGSSNASTKGRNRTNSNNTSDQTKSSNNNQTDESRNINLFELARQMNEMANGAYMNLFKRMKRYGLFLGVY